MRTAARQDDNSPELDAALTANGWLVFPTHMVGRGFPDRVIAKRGRLVLVEYKDGRKSASRRKLTPAECVTHLAFRTHGVEIVILETIADLAQLDRDVRQRFEEPSR